MATRARTSSPKCRYSFRGVVCEGKGRHFCEPRADRAQAFIEEICVHTKSVYARQAFVLEDWQREEILRPLFGWVRYDEQWNRYVRRYTVGWIELGRGNGKSELAAAIILLLQVGDDEESAEIYGAAADTKQAGKVGEVVKRMAELSPVLSKRLIYNKQSRRLIDPKTSSYYEVIPSDAKGELGHNAYGSVVDEVLAQASPDLWETLRTSQGKRPQSLLLGFTTAGNDPTGFAASMHEEMAKIQTDPERAPHVFVYLRNTPKDADPWDEKNWYFANPALGSFLSIETLRQEALEARNSPARENAFRQYRLNQWVQQQTRFIALHKWDASKGIIDAEMLKGRFCYGGLDLASSTDIAAFALDFPFEDGSHKALWRFWIPEERLPDMDTRTGGQASVWVREGFLTLTEGDVIDYQAILHGIDIDAQRFDIKELAYDRWGMAQLSQDLIDMGMNVIPFGQGFSSMSGPTKEWERLVLQGLYHHGGNPVMRWMVDNIVVRTDPAGNIKIDKQKSHEKVDGPVSSVMALGRATLHQQGAPTSGIVYGF